MTAPTWTKAAASERVLVVIPDRDSPPKRDWAYVFKPAAFALRQHLIPGSVEVVQLPVPVVDPLTLTISGREKAEGYAEAGRQLVELLERQLTVPGMLRPTRVVLLCHGWATGLQLGIRIKRQLGPDAEHARRFVAALERLQPRSVVLFACSAGDAPGSSQNKSGDAAGSLAAWIATEARCPVLAHWTAGHATRNPDLIWVGAGDQLGTEAYARGSQSYRRARALLTGSAASGMRPPVGHVRPAWASLVLCETLDEVRVLLSAEPAHE